MDNGFVAGLTAESEQSMITATEDAKQVLAATLDRMPNDESAHMCLRLTRGRAGGVAIVPGLPTSDDVAIVHDDRTVLVVQRDLAWRLQGRRIRVAPGREGQVRLELSSPDITPQR
jgi:hypothetical protein